MAKRYNRTEIASRQNHGCTVTQKKELDKRYHDHQNGIGRTFTWEETIAIAEKKLAKRKV